ncbi:MAG: septation protein A [Rhodocyclales bacterium]|jgi:intracellular septation protein|nr:septation protein A [Rhodocyclales bacterium]
MKLLFDLFPIILFFVAFKLADIYIATAVAIAATFAQIGWVWFRHRKVDNMLWVSLALIVVFGGMTLVLRDETFIKWKPTVLYWLFAVVLLGSATLFGKNLIRAMLAAQIEAPDHVWTKLNLAWAAFFAAMGGANLFVAMSFPTDIWVNFKLFGTMGLMLAFILAQGFWLNRYIAEPETKQSDEARKP